MKFLVVALKDFKLILKDRASLLPMFIAPLIFIVVLSLALGQTFEQFGSTTPVKLVVVNQDQQGQLAASVVENLKKAATANNLQIDQPQALDEAGAEKMVKDGQVGMALVIPANFSQQIQAGQKVDLRYINDPAASQQVTKPVQGLIQATVTETIGPFLIKQGLSQSLLAGNPSPAVAEAINNKLNQPVAGDISGLAVVESQVPAGLSAPKYPSVFQQNVPGYTIMYVFFIVIEMGASILRERTDGTYRRLLSAPINKAALLFGKLVPYYIVALLQIVILFGVGHFVFGMELGAHPLALLIISLVLAACATSMGLMVASFCKNDRQMRGLTNIIGLVFAALGGCMVPPLLMPDFMKNLAKITPHGWALNGYQDVMVRGANLGDVVPSLLVLGAFTVVFFGIAMRRMRFAEPH